MKTIGKRGNLAPGGYDDVQPADELAHNVEVTIDLKPILAELDFSPASETFTTAREALTAKFERIRAECFQHPVSGSVRLMPLATRPEFAKTW